MKQGKQFFFLIIFLFLSSSVHAEYLTGQDIQRVKAVTQVLSGIDGKSLQQTIDELEKTRYPHLNLIMREAMAKTYADIVRDNNVVEPKKKAWLYSMVCLNMAYVQFAGFQKQKSNTTSLNRLIRRKLREYLPADILKQPGFFYSL